MAATITTTSPADFANRQQTYFSRQLLKALDFELKLANYCQAKSLPANSAGSTIRFFRPATAKRGTATSGPRALTEGVTLTPQTAGVAVGYVDCTLKQRGDLSSVSDVVRAIDLFNTLELNTKTMGASAALDLDGLISHAIVSNPASADLSGAPNPIPVSQTTMYNSNTSYERFCGVVNTGVSLTDFNSLAAESNSAAKITRTAALGMVTKLKGVGGNPAVPMIGGKYKALIAPEIIADIRQDQTWVTAATYNNTDKIGIDRWVDFTLDGVDYTTANNPFMETAGHYGQYSPDATGAIANNIYANLYMGADAVGVPKLSGMRAGSDPYAPSMIINDGPDKADPLNQITLFGWKAFYMAVLLWTNESTDVPHLGILRSKTTFA